MAGLVATLAEATSFLRIFSAQTMGRGQISSKRSVPCFYCPSSMNSRPFSQSPSATIQGIQNTTIFKRPDRSKVEAETTVSTQIPRREIGGLRDLASSYPGKSHQPRQKQPLFTRPALSSDLLHDNKAHLTPRCSLVRCTVTLAADHPVFHTSNRVAAHFWPQSYPYDA